MTKAVILTQKEWDYLPIAIGQAIAAHAAKGYGFDVIMKDGGKKLDDREVDFWVGTIAMLFPDVAAKMKEKS